MLAEARLDRGELLAGLVVGMDRHAWNFDGAREGQQIVGGADIARVFFARRRSGRSGEVSVRVVHLSSAALCLKKKSPRAPFWRPRANIVDADV